MKNNLQRILAISFIIIIFVLSINVVSKATNFLTYDTPQRTGAINSFGNDVDRPSVLAEAILFFDSMENINIYALCCPFSLKIKYIGKTKFSLPRRLSMHINQVKGHSKKSFWIKELILIKIKPGILLLEVANNITWKEKEKFWIKEYGIRNLLNHNGGGAGGRIGNKIDRIHLFKKYLVENNYSLNTTRNYLLIAGAFLNYFKTIKPEPTHINANEIISYLDFQIKKPSRNLTITALKLFYSKIMNQPKKFISIKYCYS